MIFDLDLEPWATGMRALGEAIDEELEDVVRDTAASVAFAAKAEHEYTDRTGALTRSIRAYVPRGRFTRDTLQAEVIATAPYASFVEQGTSRMSARPYIGPALDRVTGRIEHRLHDAVEAAVRRSGLGG